MADKSTRIFQSQDQSGTNPSTYAPDGGEEIGSNSTTNALIRGHPRDPRENPTASFGLGGIMQLNDPGRCNLSNQMVRL